MHNINRRAGARGGGGDFRADSRFLDIIRLIPEIVNVISAAAGRTFGSI